MCGHLIRIRGIKLYFYTFLVISVMKLDSHYNWHAYIFLCSSDVLFDYNPKFDPAQAGLWDVKTGSETVCCAL